MRKKKIQSIGLRKMINSIAKNYGDNGGILILIGDEGMSIGVEGLSTVEVREALCTAIHYGFCVDEGIID